MKVKKYEKYVGIGFMVLGAVGIVLAVKLIQNNNKNIAKTKEMAQS